MQINVCRRAVVAALGDSLERPRDGVISAGVTCSIAGGNFIFARPIAGRNAAFSVTADF